MCGAGTEVGAVTATPSASIRRGGASHLGHGGASHLGHGASHLGQRLSRIYPAAFEPGVPGEPISSNLPSPQSQFAEAQSDAPASDDEVHQAAERAVLQIRRRLRRQARALPQDMARVLNDIAEHLLDADLSVDACRRRLGLRDTGLTTKVRFYVGDTLADVIEKRRIETSLALLVDERLTLERIAGAVGLSYRRFQRAFRQRTGWTPSELRKALRHTLDDPMFRLWCGAESGELSVAEVRQLAKYVATLASETMVEAEPGALAVRADVEPERVAEVVRLVSAVEPRSQALLRQVLRTHADYSAAHWYGQWVHRRLGRDTLAASWTAWQIANRTLGELLLLPAALRLKAVRTDPAIGGDAFFWLLVDSAAVRLMQDAAESEHYVDLALAVTEVEDSAGPGVRARHALALALHGNALRRRNRLHDAKQTFVRALEIVGAVDAEPWIVGRIHSLYASLWDRLGQPSRARRELLLAGALMKRAGDELERLRLVIKRASTLLAAGRDPSRLLNWCITSLLRYPFASDLIQAAHVTRLLALLYLVDRLTGAKLNEICALRDLLPPPASSFLAANQRQIDGLIASLQEQPELAAKVLTEAAHWYEANELPADTAVTWLQYAWVLLEEDPERAREAALKSYHYMTQTGFNSQTQRTLAKEIYLEARNHCLRRETLRLAILVRVCPKLATRLRR